MRIYINLNNHYYWPKKGIIESKVESELESNYIANHLTILSLLERILAFGTAPLLHVISAFRECQLLFYNVNPLKDGSLPCFQQGRGRVRIPWNISTHFF